MSKEDKETVRHFALKVQQLVEKGWCNENASTINLKCNEIFTKGLPKILEDFANKRLVKHTATILEPSIAFHTLVKLVDAEDIANDKIRTHDLALEVNNIAKQLHTQILEPSSHEQLMFTQPKDPNNKNKPAYKKYCSYCHRTNHSISACFKKIQILHTDLLIDTILVLDINQASCQETTILQDIQTLTDPLLDQEILDFLDLVHTLKLETNSIPYDHKTMLNQ